MLPVEFSKKQILRCSLFSSQNVQMGGSLEQNPMKEKEKSSFEQREELSCDAGRAASAGPIGSSGFKWCSGLTCTQPS